ncbi:MAG TPA: hypothetical protein VH502_00830 [Actinoplanes sp.]|jgi:hypothetical protein
MVVPNIGPEPLDPSDSDNIPRGNAASVYRDDVPTDDVSAASARASSLTHRFGGVRYALSRPTAVEAEPPSDEDG